MTATGSSPTATEAKTRLDGAGLVAMFTAAAAALQRNIEPINDLNVFPVPDGDTGTNMYLTMQSGIGDLNGLTAPSVSDVASAFYSGAFMGARGNSGVILSQFFKGFAEGLDGGTDCGSDDLARACELAREHAYKSVANPVEGTMLTVIASVADATREGAEEGHGIETLLSIASDRAAETVARTTEMLPVLQEAGVVDAGGQGLAVIIEGMRRSAAGERPPIQIGGPPGWRGGGSLETSSKRKCNPAWLAGRPRQSARSTSIASSVRRPRSRRGTWTAAKSRSPSPPTPIPRITRPPLSSSSDAICLATRLGCRSGRSSTPVPRATRSVQAATAESATTASRIGF